jgi:hypothetical protein
MKLTSCVVASALFSIGAMAQKPADGYVVDVMPGWSTAEGTPVKVGTDVQGGQTLRASGTGAATISVAYLDGALDTFRCPKGPCQYMVKSAVPKSSSWPEVFLALRNLASRRESMPINAISRGSEVLRPQVLLLKESKLALQEAVVNLDPGRYQLQFKPYAAGNNTPGAIVRGSLSWDPPSRTTASVTGLTPGVYQLTLMAEEGQSMGQEIVLVLDAVDFDRKSAMFERSRKFFDSPPADLTPAAVRNILEALLLQMGA